MHRSFALLLLALAGAVPALAQTHGTCQTGQAQRDLDVSGVHAVLRNTGALFMNDMTGGLYEVPLGTGASPVYAAGLWVGGQADGELRAAAARYDDFEFWPGPLNEDGTLPNPNDCSEFDRIWVVSALDIQHYETGGEPSTDLVEWPVELGAPVVAALDNGFDDDGDGLTDEGTDDVDNDGDGSVDEHDEQELVVPEVRQAAGLPVYHLPGGDRPEVLGTQTAFWVMNDVGNVHTETGTPPIGLEVRVSAFAVGTDAEDAALYPSTFYRYTLIKKTPGALENAYLSLFLDADVGDGGDDYVGSDPMRGLAFAYNAAPTDDVYGLPPAVGLDIFRGPVTDVDGDGETDDTLTTSRVMYFSNIGNVPTGGPQDGPEYYNVMRGFWRDGTPLTEGGDGYQTGGSLVPFAFPAPPEAAAFWSEVNADGEGGSTTPGDRRLVASVGPFSLSQGESHTFDVGLLFAQGDGHLESVTELRAVSDETQAHYDGGTLFAPFDAPPPVPLAIPALTAPADGAVFTDADVTLMWTGVPGALRYRVERSTSPDFQDPTTFFSLVSELTLTSETFPANEVATYYWRVRAERYGYVSSFPPARSFTHYRYAFDYLGYGNGIVEMAYPGAEVCPDEGDPGCATGYPGNTVWLHPSSTDDYVLTNSDNDLSELLRHPEVIEGDDFEIRFTEACDWVGDCLAVAVNGLAELRDGEGVVMSVPFELWNTGAEGDPSDDVRMIPIVRGTEPSVEWADTFPAEQEVIVGGETLTLPVTQAVHAMMPDRPSGYELFEQAAHGFGLGDFYDHESDGDEQVDIYINPSTGEERPCRIQHYYVDFCYRNAHSLFAAPLGGNRGFVLADLAGDGTTPPEGTTIRFDANERLLPVGAEEDGPEARPQAFALEAAYPNPFRTSATVGYRLGAAAEVRLMVYDVLGRQVAVLAEGPQAAGAHRATFEARGLASGVYLVVLEAAGQRQVRKVMLVR